MILAVYSELPKKVAEAVLVRNLRMGAMSGNHMYVMVRGKCRYTI